MFELLKLYMNDKNNLHPPLTCMFINLFVNPAPVLLDVGPQPGHDGVPGSEGGPGQVQQCGLLAWKHQVQQHERRVDLPSFRVCLQAWCWLVVGESPSRVTSLAQAEAPR